MNHIWIPYCGAAPVPSELLGRWNFDPPLLLVLALAPLAYFALIGPEQRGSPRAFWGAWTLGLLLFVSPFCALTSALFSARAVHHLLLAIVLAPLVILALGCGRPRGPVAVWTLVASTTFWFWHAPAIYSAALSNILVYWLMQLSIAVSAVLFWAAIARSSLPSAIGGLLIAMVAMGLLGALITFAPAPLYPPHFMTTQAWGMAPLEDQQLAGLIMWAPGGGFYLAAALLLAARWLRREQLAGAMS